MASLIANSPPYMTNDPHPITRFLWWCAGADEHFLLSSPMQDRVKYAGIGGIVFCTGLLAAVSGGYAFHTVFGPKGDAIDYSLTTSIAVKFATLIFAAVWGIIIFNLDRFIVSSTGKGDGTDKITWKEFGQALPRIIIAVILGFAISAPLEIRILESEINSELSKFQKGYVQELNTVTDSVFKQKRLSLEKEKSEYEAKKAEYEKSLSDYDTQIDDLTKRRQAEMQDKRAYGDGPVAKKMQADIDTKRGEKAQFIATKKSDVGSWQKQLDFSNDQLNKLSDDLRDEYKANEAKAHGYDGLLKRIQISHEIGGVVPWLILAVFLCIETGPIIFKMMMTKGVYDFKVENFNNTKNVENGIYREDHVYEGSKGLIHVEKWRFLQVEVKWDEMSRLAEEQKKINQEIIDQWSSIKVAQVRKDPTLFFIEGDENKIGTVPVTGTVSGAAPASGTGSLVGTPPAAGSTAVSVATPVSGSGSHVGTPPAAGSTAVSGAIPASGTGSPAGAPSAAGSTAISGATPASGTGNPVGEPPAASPSAVSGATPATGTGSLPGISLEGESDAPPGDGQGVTGIQSGTN